jgi:hypothetical protein
MLSEVEQMEQSNEQTMNRNLFNFAQEELCGGTSHLREMNKGSGGVAAAPMPKVRIPSPGDPSAYFAPISPAAKTSGEPSAIFNMLRVSATGTPWSVLDHALCFFVQVR